MSPTELGATNRNNPWIFNDPLGQVRAYYYYLGLNCFSVASLNLSRMGGLGDQGLALEYLSQATSTRKQGLKKYMAKHLCASERSYKIDPPCLRVLEYFLPGTSTSTCIWSWSACTSTALTVAYAQCGRNPNVILGVKFAGGGYVRLIS